MPLLFGELRSFSNLVAFAFGRLGMDDHRAPHPFGQLQCLFDAGHIVPINGANVFDPQLFKKQAGGHDAQRFVNALEDVRCSIRRDRFETILDHFFNLGVDRPGHGAREVAADRTDRCGDAHLIVIQNNHHGVLALSELV